MKQFLITLAGVLVGLILFLVIAPIVIIGQITTAVRDMGDQGPTKDAVVLTLDLRSDVTDQPNPSPFAAFGGGGVNTLDIVRKLDAAAKDKRVKGIYIRAASGGMAPASAEEIRDAIATFRKSGKFAIAHIQNEGPRQSIAGFATVAGVDELWLQAAGEFMPMGLVAEETFLADTLANFKLVAQFETREEYKTAANTLTQRGFTPADRESTEGLLGSIYDTFVKTIAADRKMTPEQAKAIIESTPFTADDAVAKKFIDKLGRPEEAEEAALARAGGEKAAEFMDLSRYAAKSESGGSGPAIAIVSGEGAIVTDGGGDDSPFSSEAAMVGDQVAKNILDAANDPDVKAIVFRVSSPGGSVVASDQIWHAVETAQKKGKKVVVSMGAYAASGGYYVSAGADDIVAWPSTITGSIGVVGGKIVIGGASQFYLKTRTETIQFGSPLANMWTADRGFNPAERAAIATYIQRAYDGFLERVKDGRGFASIEETRAVAKGRVWTGAQALDLKLVNRFGGLNVAIARARELAGIKADADVRIVNYPERKSPFEALQSIFGASENTVRTMALLSAVMNDQQVNALLREVADHRRTSAGVRAEENLPTVR